MTLNIHKEGIDNWNPYELILLCDLVDNSSDPNWVSISRQMKNHSMFNRPMDWYSQKNCAQQYNHLISQFEGPKRKRGNDTSSPMVSGHSPSESIREQLRVMREEELNDTLAQQIKDYLEIQEELDLLDDPNCPEEVVDRIYAKELEDARMDEEEKNREEDLYKKRAEALEKESMKRSSLHSSNRPTRGAAAISAANANAKKMPESSKIDNESQEDKKSANDKENKDKSENKSTSLLQTLLETNTDSATLTEKNSVNPTTEIDSIKKEPIDSDDNKDSPVDSSVKEDKEEEKESKPRGTSTLSRLLSMPSSKMGEVTKNEKDNKAESKDVAKKEKIDEESMEVDVKEENIKPDTEKKRKSDESKSEQSSDKDTSSATSTPTSTTNTRSTRGSNRVSEAEVPNDDEKKTPTTTSRDKRNKRLSERSDQDTVEENNSRTSTTSRSRNVSRRDEAQEETDKTLEHPLVSRLKNSNTEKASSELGTPPSSSSGSGTPLRVRRGSGASNSRSSSPAGSEKDKPDDEGSTTRRLRVRSKQRGSECEEPAIETGNLLDPEMDPKTFKKHALLIWDNMTQHKFSHLVQQPINDPDYKKAIKNPLDLNSIKRQIETGALKNMSDFKRDVLLMLVNVTMYYTVDSEQYNRALVMSEDFQNAFDNFKNTQLLIKINNLDSSSPASNRSERSNRKDRRDSNRKRPLAEDSGQSSTGSSTKKRRK